MKILTVCQPWAWAICHAGKRIENRTWMTGYRGPLAIHAGWSTMWLGSLDPSDYPGCPAVPPRRELAIHAGWSTMWLGSLDPSDHPGCPAVPPRRELAMGAVVAVCDLVDCVSLVAALRRFDVASGVVWAEGPWCWVLDNVRVLSRPVTRRGARGLTDVDEADARALVDLAKQAAV